MPPSSPSSAPSRSSTITFDNRFVAELPGDPEQSPRRRQVLGACWSAADPTPVAAPVLVAHSREVAALVGFSDADVGSSWFAAVFGGNALLPGMQPYAACYGGHQFGHWAGQLGDGRAITLGEVVTTASGEAEHGHREHSESRPERSESYPERSDRHRERSERWELQLKGAGPTPYSRTADGRAVLRSSIREFLCSEAMHHLGVPTTRALSLVATGDAVMRDMFYDGNARTEPGAIVCRVAPSFIRFGNFEIFASRGDRATLEQLVDFTIARDFPHLVHEGDTQAQRAAWLMEVAERTARMIVGWMRVGFVHGVMNTDNMSILGLTIDYGPYGWLDAYDPTWTPNTTDAGGRRYRFGQQPAIAQWNLVKLAEAVMPLFTSTEPLQQAIDRYSALFTSEYEAMTRAKFGIVGSGDDDLVRAIIDDGYGLLHDAEIDHTLFFRALGDMPGALPDESAAAIALLGDLFYDDAKRAEHMEALALWLRRWHLRVSRADEPPAVRRARMHGVNPRWVPRNYLAQQAIDLAERGDYSLVHTLLDIMRRPYEEQPEHAALLGGRRPEWARNRAGSSMLSCSS